MLRAITRLLIPLTYAQLVLIEISCSTDCVCKVSTKCAAQIIRVKAVCQHFQHVHWLA